VKVRVGILYEDYKEPVYWWEVEELIRRFLLSSALVFFRGMDAGTTIQAGLAIFIAVSAHLLHTFHSPFRDDVLNYLQHTCLTALWLIFLLGLMNDVFSSFSELHEREQNSAGHWEQYAAAMDSGMYIVFGSVLLIGVSSIAFHVGVKEEKMQPVLEGVKSLQKHFSAFASGRNIKTRTEELSQSAADFRFEEVFPDTNRRTFASHSMADTLNPLCGNSKGSERQLNQITPK